ncbi:class I SAM-dependent methyltransferase [Nostoc sp. MG11]|uniref:class I SAM-dependent methyltransferase n=1 Tax=Nostoc sp. MG11 TaxID=2721166 RepID=UPI001867FDB3|nr:class I SAM-dependent methyltransferase [Nostoc sp. MG11]
MTSLPDYKNDPEAYEIEEHSRPDEMLMLEVAGEMAVESLKNTHNAVVLDLCCGTGLSLERIINHPNISCAVGVDICQPYLDFAKRKYEQCRLKPTFILGDAVSVKLPREQWDVIMLASAYHHIEHERKVEFLNRVHYLLDNSGYAIIAENVLPEYEEGNTEEYAHAVKQFYTEVLNTAKQQNPHLPDYVANLIKRVAQYGYDGDYEYKVSLSLLLKDLAKARLQIVTQKRVWPQDESKLGKTGGNYVFKVCCL